jgi:SAM-dependent methyltransferase
MSLRDEDGGPEAAAAAYDRHVGRYGSQLAEGLLAAAGVRRGHRVLDVGCGPGPLTAAVAALVGADRVAAVDPSQDFVIACRARVPGADVRVGVAERLPFEDDSFDVVLAQLVVPLMEDRDAGVREMARVACPGGIVAACVWDATTMPMLCAFWDAVLAVAADRAGAFDEGRRVGFPSPEGLEQLWSACGLTDLRTGETRVTASYDDFDDLFVPFTAGTGNSGSVYRSLDRVGRERLRAEAFRRLGEPSDGFTLTARAWWVRGEA